MQSHKVEVKEFLSRIIEINAENVDIAITKVKKMYQNEEIVLDSSDYVTTEIVEFIE